MQTHSATEQELTAELRTSYAGIDPAALALLLGDRSALETAVELPEAVQRHLPGAVLRLELFGDDPYRKALVLINAGGDDEAALMGISAFEREWWHKPLNYNNLIVVDLDYDV